MSDGDHLKPNSYGHGHSGSIDTNASANAESTISLGLSRFPEPPSSTPSTPLRSEFGGTPSPSRTTFPQSVHLNSPQRLSMHAGRSNLSSLHAASRGRSFKTNSTSFYAPHAKDNVPGSSQTPSANESDGTSIIDVDTLATEGRILPTSFIAALSQENKVQRKIERDTMSGIPEMTYPPLLDQFDTDNALYACNPSGRPLTSHIPPPASIQARKPFNRISSDSETLHFQGHTPIIRTASVSRGVFSPGASVVGIAPATLCNVSGTKRCSSSVDGLSIDKSLHRSTYEPADDLSDSKTFDSLSPFLSTQRVLHGKPAEPHFKDTVVDPAPTSLLSRISRMSLRRKKVEPLPAVPEFPLTMGYAHRRHEESAPLPELISRAVALRDLLGKGQNVHHSDALSARPSAPLSVRGTGGLKPETISIAAASHLSSSHTIPSAKHQPAATDASASRKKKRMYFLVFFILIVALAAIGAGVGVSVASRKKQPLPACAGNFTGVACNLGNDFLSSSLIALINIPDATCVCTSSAGCNGLAQAVVDLIPMINQNFATNISLTSAYNSLWIMQGSPTTSNCASQALLADIGDGNNENLYPNHTQWAQTALLWNAIQTEDVDAAGQLQQFVQKIPWTSLGTDGPVSTVVDSEQGFSTTVAGFIFNFASQTVTPPSASFVTLGQPTNAQISRVSSQTQSTLDRMYAFAQGMSFTQYFDRSTQARENSLLNPASDRTEDILGIGATPTPTRPCCFHGRAERLASLIAFQRIVAVNSISLLKFNFFLISTSSGMFSRSDERSTTANQLGRNWRLWFTTDCKYHL
jgi:hypothetical protein